MSYLATSIKGNRLNTVEYENKNDIPGDALKVVEIVKNKPIFKAVVDYCNDPENPIKSDCPVNFAISENFRYATGNFNLNALYEKYGTDNPEKLISKIKRAGGYATKLNAYVHSGVTLLPLSVNSFDCSKIGYAFIDPGLMKNPDNEYMRTHAGEIVTNWLKIYSQYLNGSVYELKIYELVNNQWELIETMPGFYKIEDMDYYINDYEPCIKEINV